MGGVTSKDGDFHGGRIIRNPATSDYTAILVQSDGGNGHAGPGGGDEDGDVVALELNSSVMGLKFSGGIPPSLDSPSDCTTLSSVSTVTATPLDTKHRYHLFFAHHPADEGWVGEMVRRLEQEPYNYRCCYASRDFKDSDVAGRVQSILCAIMLSQRVVVVLSPAFLAHAWPEYEDSIAHLTSLSQRRQRIVPVMLADCQVPDSLKGWQPLDATLEDFWDALFRALHVDGFPFSDSMLTVRSFSHQYSGFQNGHILSTTKGSIEGFCRSRLLFDYDEVPEALLVNDVALSRQDYADLIRLVGREEVGARLSWLFSALPTVALGTVFVLWCVTFILIIILYPDDRTSTLPVRLCVFCLPAAFIVIGCVLRWKTLKTSKEQYSMAMFSRSVQVNRILHDKSKPVIVTTSRTHDDIFHIHFLYFDRSECIERIKIFLTHCSDEEHLKLGKLIEVYTLNATYLHTKPLAVRLAVMTSAAYAVNLIYRRIPPSLEQRHTRRRQCLCQFVEEFLAAYLPSLRHNHTPPDLQTLRTVFSRYLNCELKPDPLVLHTLGICYGDA